MSKTIEAVLARRSDLSTFLVHLTRTTDDMDADDKLESILKGQKLEARNAFGPAVPRLEKVKQSVDSQKCVCFTETPLEHVSLLLGKIDNRNCDFKPYGVAITRKQGRKEGVNPVWYTDMTVGHDWICHHHIEPLIDEAINSGRFDKSHVAAISPFIEQMGSGKSEFSEKGYKKEFWWEREWRKVGNFRLPTHLIVLCPEDEIRRFRTVVDNLDKDDCFIRPRFIDPRWSLEMIIGRLAGFSSDEVGPF